MTRPDTNPIVVEVGDQWSYRIDATTAPAYVVITQTGAADGDALSRTLTALVRVMDEVIGPGQRFCPFIVDLRAAIPGRLSIPSGHSAIGAIQRRITRAVLIVDAKNKDILFGFLGLLSKIVPDLDVVSSMDEARAKLGV